MEIRKLVQSRKQVKVLMKEAGISQEQYMQVRLSVFSPISEVIEIVGGRYGRALGNPTTRTWVQISAIIESSYENKFLTLNTALNEKQASL